MGINVKAELIDAPAIETEVAPEPSPDEPERILDPGEEEAAAADAPADGGAEAKPADAGASGVQADAEVKPAAE